MARKLVSNWSGSQWREVTHREREYRPGPLGLAFMAWMFVWGVFAGLGAGYGFLWLTLWIAVALLAAIVALLIIARWDNRGGPRARYERQRQRDIRKYYDRMQP